MFLSITMSVGVPIDSGGASLRSKDLDYMHKRLVQASDGSPPWKRALAGVEQHLLPNHVQVKRSDAVLLHDGSCNSCLVLYEWLGVCKVCTPH